MKVLNVALPNTLSYSTFSEVFSLFFTRVLSIPVHSDGDHIHQGGGHVAVKEKGKDSTEFRTEDPVLVNISETRKEMSVKTDPDDQRSATAGSRIPKSRPCQYLRKRYFN